MTGTVEVWTWEPNANSGKPLLCLHEKGVPFVHHHVDMGAREHHEPAYLAINPAGTVPTVVHGGLKLTESTPPWSTSTTRSPARRCGRRIGAALADALGPEGDGQLGMPGLAMLASNALAAPRFRETAEEEKRAALAKIPDPERRRTWDLLMHDGREVPIAGFNRPSSILLAEAFAIRGDLIEAVGTSVPYYSDTGWAR